MANLTRCALASATAALLASACSVPETTTDLHPEGPPMLQQAFMSEVDGGRRVVLGFGWHPEVTNGRAPEGEEPEATDNTHPVTKAAVANQSFRFVFDELLVGNGLEEIACRDGSFSRVPLGATPDDIANCSVADDLLVQFCKGEHAVCLNGSGIPVGVLDEDENGSADNTQMIDGALRIVCGSITVPLNRESSFWQPSGNQLVPAGQVPQSSLGPAIIAVPANGLLPGSQDCRIEFAGDVTDKEFNRPCAPIGGMEDTDNLGDCASGDMSAFSFTTEDIGLDSSVPSNNATGIAVTRRVIALILTARPDPATVPTAAVTVMQGATPRTDFTVALNMANAQRVEITLAANLLPATTYTVTLGNLTDTFGVAISPLSISFTTAP